VASAGAFPADCGIHFAGPNANDLVPEEGNFFPGRFCQEGSELSKICRVIRAFYAAGVLATAMLRAWCC